MVVAVELAEQMLAKLPNLAGIARIRGDLSRLPFRSNAFDCVILAAVLQHLSNPIAALAQVNESLRSGGSLYFLPGRTSAESNNPHKMLSSYFRHTLGLPASQGNAANYRRLLGLIRDSGFEPVGVEAIHGTIVQSPASELGFIERSAYDWTWDVSPTKKEAALESLRAFADARWTDLTVQIPVEYTWEWWDFKKPSR
jgi:SAM-dependent methyltransferase